MSEAALLQGNIYKQFARYVSLNIISMLGLSIYIVADTFFVANGIGLAGLVALNLSLPVFGFVVGIGWLIGMGGATLFSISLGKGERENLDIIFSQSLTLGIILSIIVVLIGFFFSTDISRLFGAKGVNLPLTDTYIKTVMMFAPAFIINNIMIAFNRNDGRPNIAMIAMLSGSLGNIVFDYIFIYPLQMGIFGAALATGFSPLFSLFILSFPFFQKKTSFHFTHLLLIKNLIGRIFSLGMSFFINEISGGVIIFLFNTVVLAIAGDMGVAAYGIIANVSMVGTAIFAGMGQGVQPLLSINFGSGKKKNLRKLLFCGLSLAFVFGIAFYAFSYLFADEIASVFNKDNDPILNTMTIKGMKIYFTAYVVMGLNIIATSFLVSIDRAKLSFVLALLRGFVLITI
ncbi:MAG: MATE family efflux transporter, partial [Clostridiales bacterium]